LVDPAGKCDEEKPERIRQRNHGPRVSDARVAFLGGREAPACHRSCSGRTPPGSIELLNITGLDVPHSCIWIKVYWEEPTMSEAQEFEPNNNREDMNKIIATATERAKAKNARLRHMKERNENYLAERRE